MTPSVNLVVIRSPDIDRAVSLYREIGLSFEKHSHGSGPEHYASESQGIVFEIYPQSGDADSTSSTRIGFCVGSVDDVFDRVCKLGAEAVSRPKNSPWGRRAVVRDFDGHTVELTAQEI